MKAAFLRAYGGVDQLDYGDAPDPKPGEGEVLVKISGIGLNPLDWKLRAGYLKDVIPLPLPVILGRDFSGEVIEVGPGAAGFKNGDKVFGSANGTYAELIAVKASEIAPIPNYMSIADAAVLPVVTLTGAELIEDGVKPKSGDTVLVTGALGGVGRTAVYVAKSHGAKVIAGVRKAQKEEAKSLGADEVVAIDDAGEVAALEPVDAIADTVGGPAIEGLLAKVKKGGVVASLLGPIPAAEKAGLRVAQVYFHPDPKRQVELAEKVRDGEIAIPVSARFKLSQIREAHSAGEKGGAVKILVTP